jgi:hypothetical protein
MIIVFSLETEISSTNVNIYMISNEVRHERILSFVFIECMIKSRISFFSSEEDFISPIQKLTKEELREELKIFNQTSHAALLANDEDDEETGDLQFRIQQPLKHSICCYDHSFSCTIS